jgi:hypothetical protein
MKNCVHPTGCTLCPWCGYRAKVYLDGVEQTEVVDFSEAGGWLIKYGDPVVVLNERLLWHKLFGVVEVIADNLDH